MNPKNSESRYMADDSEDRRRAIEETDRSFVMEASAGTGKTHTLINRILHLVLEKGPDGPPVRLSEICAITFTEKAAGEMKVRLRQYLEEKLSECRTKPGYQERIRRALEDLETASISTFHSFAVGLLKERPIEAGLDPHFSALDDVQSELYFREVWESWISRALENRDPVLEKALRNGYRLGGLEDLARILRLNWLSVRDLKCDRPQSEEIYRERIQDCCQKGKELLQRSLKAGDKLTGLLSKSLDWLERPDPEAEALSKPGSAGAAANWSGGKDTVQEVKEFLREVLELRISYENLPAQMLLYEVIRWMLTDFMREEWEKRKQADGLLDFDDQLYLARDLLRKHRTVRHEFQERYKTLLVDEFQDTDPIQLEIVLRLTSKDSGQQDVATLCPEPGRLFIVGDPKQSIYRFRNADIETYLGIVDAPELQKRGIERLCLTTNFRSVPSILSFVDAAFKDAMRKPDDGGKYQPDYLAFEGHGSRKVEPHVPSVHLLGDFSGGNGAKRSTREFIECESRQIARQILEIHGSASWEVQDASSAEKDGWRAPRFGDMAILLPVLSQADALEDALRERNIPYVLEGGKFYYSRSEVASAINVLRAVANPNDAVALYGSLRSIFFGLSDEDLLKARVDGIPFDYRKPVPAGSPLGQPFEILLDLHRYRHERRASETFETLLQKTGAREVLSVRGYQSLANLNKIGRTLRALQGDSGFAQVIDLLSAMDEEGLAESESRLMEERSDAVRIMSIHKSKGLDFPIVFVASLGLKKQARVKNLLTDLHDKKVFALKVGARDSGLHTANWDLLVEREKKREEAELVRLLYVALTRARDHMILSTHTANAKRLDGEELSLPEVDGTRLKPLEPILNECLPGNGSFARRIDAASLPAAAIPSRPAQMSIPRDWISIARQQYRELQNLLGNTPAAGYLKAAGEAQEPVDPEDAASEERVPEAAQKRSIRLGTAFHEAMERVDLFDQSGLAACFQELSMRHRLDPESSLRLRDLIETCLSSRLMDQVRAAANSGGRILREVPFVRPLNGSEIEEGKIDLLFEEGEGWVLVDYKTDWVSRDRESMEAHFRHRYSVQIREYAEALQGMAVKVNAAYLLLARTGDAIKML